MADVINKGENSAAHLFRSVAKVVLLFRVARRVTQFSLGVPNRHSLPDGQAGEPQKRW